MIGDEVVNPCLAWSAGLTSCSISPAVGKQIGEHRSWLCASWCALAGDGKKPLFSSVSSESWKGASGSPSLTCAFPGAELSFPDVTFQFLAKAQFESRYPDFSIQ